MATESVAVPGVPGTRAPAQVPVIDKGLKKNAIGYLSNVVIGVASTAPAYSLAATLGFIVAVKGAGTHAPAVLLVSFVPMLLIAAAYRFLNRADPDAGTTFAWTTRALGPGLGWVNGWVIWVPLESSVFCPCGNKMFRPGTSASPTVPNAPAGIPIFWNSVICSTFD